MSWDDQYRLFVDECGDHASNHQTMLDKRFLGVVGAAFRNGDAKELRQSIAAFKEKYCEDYDADCPPVLHREDIIGKQKGFEWLCDEQKQREFYPALLTEIEQAKFVVFAVVVDKWSHGQRTNRTLKHPYHYCLHVLLEKYVRFLCQQNTQGDVMFEARGKEEDEALKAEYRRNYTFGTYYVAAANFKATLTSKELKIKRKESNIAGLQIADLIAFAATRDVLAVYDLRSAKNMKYFDRRVRMALASKYYQGRSPSGAMLTKGCGQVILR